MNFIFWISARKSKRWINKRSSIKILFSLNSDKSQGGGFCTVLEPTLEKAIWVLVWCCHWWDKMTYQRTHAVSGIFRPLRSIRINFCYLRAMIVLFFLTKFERSMFLTENSTLNKFYSRLGVDSTSDRNYKKTYFIFLWKMLSFQKF